MRLIRTGMSPSHGAPRHLLLYHHLHSLTRLVPQVCRWIVDEEERDATELLSDPVELEALIKRWKDRRVKLQTRRPTGLNDREDSDTDSDSDGDNSEGVVDSACKLDDEEVVNLEIRHCVTPWSCGPNCSGSCRVGNR